MSQKEKVLSGPVTLGKCADCGQSFTRAAMALHLPMCQEKLERLDRNAEKRAGTGGTPGWYSAHLISLLVQDKYAPETYWMYLEAPASNSLLKLDSALRFLWLECCGHLSEFEIRGKIYARYPDREYNDRQERAMNGVKLEKVSRPSEEFSYVFDYGTTTELVLKSAFEWEGEVLGKRPEFGIMARNSMPDIKCEECLTAPAEMVCPGGMSGNQRPGWDEYGRLWLCQRHALGKKYGDLRHYYLPVLNSPRAGRCGFDGTYTPTIERWSMRPGVKTTSVGES